MYKIIKTNEEPFKTLIVPNASMSTSAMIDKLNSDLKDMNIKGTILIDLILYMGNYQERFVTCECDKGIDKSSLQFQQISKKSPYRKLSCQYLKDSGFAKHPMVTKIQYDMIMKGITI